MRQRRAPEQPELVVAACRERLAGVEVQVATAEDLPYPDGTFDAALAQLVVHFMSDPVAGLTEMRRVTRPGGSVAACVWDLADHRSIFVLEDAERAGHATHTIFVDDRDPLCRGFQIS